MESEFVTIATYPHSLEARMAAIRLEAEGIPVVLLDEFTNNLLGGEVRLQVPEEIADDALYILDTMMDEEVEILEEMGEETEIERGRETAPDWKEVPAADSPVICPRCESPNSLKTVPSPVPPWLNVLLLGFPGLFFPARQQCRGCGAIIR